MPVIVIPLAVVFSIFMSVVFMSNAEQISSPPKLEDFQSQTADKKEEIECGTIFVYNDEKTVVSGVAFYKTKENKVFITISWNQETKAWGAWVDKNTDGVIDEYYPTIHFILDKYSRSPCDVLK